MALFQKLSGEILRWNYGAVRLIAQSIREGIKFDQGRMPILADALEDAGCTDRKILNHCREDIRHIKGCPLLDIILGKVINEPDTFVLVVDYDRPFEDAVKAECYHWVNPSIESDYFPVSPFDEHGKKEKTGKLYGFEQEVDCEQVHTRMVADHYRSASFLELSEMAKTYDGIILGFSIVGLNSVWALNDGLAVARVFGTSGGKIILDLDSIDTRWSPYRCKFLGIKVE